MGVKPGNTSLSVPVGRLIVVLFTLLLSSSLMAQEASVRSELSASTITRDETVTLTVTAMGTDGELDASALEKDFDVVGQSSSRQISTVANGGQKPVTISIVKWTLELLPRNVGVFTVPAVTVGGVSSQLLSLTVNEIPAGAQRDVFVEASVDSRTPWVQSQVLMTVRVFQAIEIVEGGLSDPTGEGLQVQRIGKDNYTEEERDGRKYRVTERRFALFAQKSGSVTIDPVVLSVSVPANVSASVGFFSPTRKLTRRTDPITLDVQARPSSDSSTAWWLPASAVQLDSVWADDVSKAVVDQPLTRTLILRAGGVMDSQLPDISIPAIDGVSLYAEEPVRAMGVDDRGLVAEQTIKWALIPQREGELVLPELSVEWFNTETGKTETAVLPEERIQVAGAVATAAASAADSTPPPGAVEGAADSVEPLASLDASNKDGASRESATEASESESSLTGAERAVTPEGSSGDMAVPGTDVNPATAASGLSNAGASSPLTGGVSSEPWRLATMLLLALWIISLGVFWWWRRGLLQARDDAPSSERGQMSAIRQRARQGYQKLAPLADVERCCKAADPAALRVALIDWAARQWPQQPPRTLTDISLHLNEGAARESLTALDAALYSRHAAHKDNAELMLRMRQLPGELSAALASGEPDDTAVILADGRQRGHGLPAL